MSKHMLGNFKNVKKVNHVCRTNSDVPVKLVPFGSFLAYVPKVGLCVLHGICVSVNPPC